MFNSKYFLIVAVLTFLMIGAGIFFQFQEMQEYNLLETLQERFFSGSNTAEAAPVATAAPAAAAPAAAPAPEKANEEAPAPK